MNHPLPWRIHDPNREWAEEIERINPEHKAYRPLQVLDAEGGMVFRVEGTRKLAVVEFIVATCNGTVK